MENYGVEVSSTVRCLDDVNGPTNSFLSKKCMKVDSALWAKHTDRYSCVGRWETEVKF